VYRRPPLVLLAVLGVTAASLLLAACGGSSSPGVAHVGATSSSSPAGGSSGGTPESTETSAGAQQKAAKFAQCMRTHGEPEFPEPVEGHIQLQRQNGHGPNPESSQFKAAEKACSKYAPSRVVPSPAQQAKMQEQALKFSNGGTSLKIGSSSGIDPSSPQFQAAQKACQSDSPLGRAPTAAPTGVGAGQSSSESSVSAP
jgi:hypothetical protein